MTSTRLSLDGCRNPSYVELSSVDVIQTLPERHVARLTKVQTVPKNAEFEFSHVNDVTLITFQSTRENHSWVYLPQMTL